MSPWEVILWWGLLVLGVIGSALYSGLETGAYSLNRVRLQILQHQGVGVAGTLAGLLKRRVSLLVTLLIGNNLANYLGTAGLAMILEDWGFDDLRVILFNVLIITPVLLVFGETIPKDLFSAHGDRLMYRFSGFLVWSRRVFTWIGLLPLVVGISHLLTRMLGIRHAVTAFHPRRQVHALVLEGVGHGVLSDVQSAMVERVLELSALCVGDEMIPWKKVIKVRISDPPRVLWDLADRTSYSRFPVIDKPGNPVGMIHVRDALMHKPDRCPPIQDLIHPIETIDATTPLREALTTIQTRRQAMTLVTRDNKPVGIVTIKDLIEPIIGELASW